MMNDKTKLSQTDSELFRQAVHDVTPLAKNKKVDLGALKMPRRRNKATHAGRSTTLDPSMSHGHQDIVGPNDTISFAQPGLCLRQKGRLKGGDYPIEACLDLHGKRYHHAQTLLVHFLQHHKHRRCVLIIHGKGNHNGQGSMIKSLVNEQLRSHSRVLAFHSAQAYDGGTGALYVLLKSAECSK